MNLPGIAATEHRILVVLELSPMTPPQLESLLSLNRTTVLRRLRALEQQHKITRHRRCSPRNGAWPDQFLLANQSTTTGAT